MINFFEESNSDLEGTYWKYYKYESKNANSFINNHKGTIIISGDKAKTESNIVNSLQDSFNKIFFRCITSGDID